LGLTRTISPGMLGLSLTYCLAVVNNLNDLIGSLTETEQEMVSVERIAEYIDIPSEHEGDKVREKLERDLQLSVDNNIIDQHINKESGMKWSNNIDHDIITSKFLSIQSLQNRVFGRTQKSKRVKRNSAHMDPESLRRPLIDLKNNADDGNGDMRNENEKTKMMNYEHEETGMNQQILGGNIVFKEVFQFYNQKSTSPLAALSNLSISIPTVSCA
jgi:ABC-type multidrug transport system fused ATPase/permease subunit